MQLLKPNSPVAAWSARNMSSIVHSRRCDTLQVNVQLRFDTLATGGTRLRVAECVRGVIAHCSLIENSTSIIHPIKAGSKRRMRALAPVSAPRPASLLHSSSPNWHIKPATVCPVNSSGAVRRPTRRVAVQASKGSKNGEGEHPLRSAPNAAQPAPPRRPTHRCRPHRRQFG